MPNCKEIAAQEAKAFSDTQRKLEVVRAKALVLTRVSFAGAQPAVHVRHKKSPIQLQPCALDCRVACERDFSVRAAQGEATSQQSG